MNKLAKAQETLRFAQIALSLEPTMDNKIAYAEAALYVHILEGARNGGSVALEAYERERLKLERTLFNLRAVQQGLQTVSARH